jgi:hypothetical protein
MTLTTIAKIVLKTGYTHIMAANGKISPLSEVKGNSQGWFFNGAYGYPNITKFGKNGKNLGHYKLLPETWNPEN